MATNNVLSVNGNNRFKAPSSLDWGLQDVSDSDTGRDQTAYMYKNRICQKRKLSLKWNALSKLELYEIVNAFNDEYFNVTYYDPLEGTEVTKEFYCGDRSAPVNMWTDGIQVYTSCTFNIIER